MSNLAQSFALKPEEIKKIQAWERGEIIPSEGNEDDLITEERADEIKKQAEDIQKLRDVQGKEQISKQKRAQEASDYQRRIEYERAMRQRKARMMTGGVGGRYQSMFTNGIHSLSGTQQARMRVFEGSKTGKA